MKQLMKFLGISSLVVILVAVINMVLSAVVVGFGYKVGIIDVFNFASVSLGAVALFMIQLCFLFVLVLGIILEDDNW